MADKGTQETGAITILWRIENISLWEKESVAIQSPRFAFYNLKETMLYLILNFMCEGKDVYLGVRQAGNVKFPISFECSILDSNGSPLITGTRRYWFDGVHPTVDLHFIPTEEEIMDCKQKDALIVKCRIYKSRGDPFEHFSLLSRIVAREVSFLWPIKRFSSLELSKEVTASEYLSLYNLEDIYLSFSLEGKSLLDSKINFHIQVTLRSYSWIKLKISVLGDSQKVLKCVERQCGFYEFDRVINIPIPISRKELLEGQSGCLDSDVLTLHCIIIQTFCTKSISNYDLQPLNMNKGSTKNTSTSRELGHRSLGLDIDSPEGAEDTNLCLNILRKDFLYMYQEKTFSDFELRSDGVVFPVHKCVLCARSPVFRAMFYSETKLLDFLDVPDFDAHTLNSFLTFLYSGAVNNLDVEDAVNLYRAADKFDVLSLKEICNSAFRSSISLSNMGDFLVMADRYRDQELTSIVHDFILNDFNEVLESKEWESVLEKNPVLAGKMTYQVLQKEFQLSKHPAQ